MFAPEADVILANRLVDIAREKVIDLTIPKIKAGGGVSLFEELSNEIQAALAGLSVDEFEELLTGEIARMGRDNVKEASLVFGVAKRPESDGIHARDVHRAKISAVISWVSRTRRSLGWSCGLANKWNPIFAF